MFIIVILINIVITLQVFNQGPSSDEIALLLFTQWFMLQVKVCIPSALRIDWFLKESQRGRPVGNYSPFTKTPQCCSTFIPLIFSS